MPVNRFISTDNRPRSRMGDVSFRGFRSRPYSASLPDGVAAYAGNMRMDRQVAKVRAGLEQLANDISLTNPPLVLDFALAADVAVTSITRSGATATVTTTTNHGYSTGNVVNIRGAGQAEYNGDFTITVTGLNTFTYTVTGTPATPATGTIVANKGPRVFANYADRVRASCVYADDDNNEGIVFVTSSRGFLYREGQATVELTFPAGEDIDDTDTCDLVQFLDKVYLFRGRKLASPISISSLTQAAGTATCTTGSNHNLATNDWVDVRGASPDGYNGIVQVTVTGATTFTYTVSGALASPATLTSATIMAVKAPMSWDRNTANDFVRVSTGPHASGAGFRKMPAADWALPFMQRFVIPYDRDELILSDALDADTYDTTFAQLRLEPGSKDWIVGAHVYQDFQLLVFMRKSIHMLELDASLEPYALKAITRDIGCIARGSIVTAGGRILWLSEQGVHALNIGDLLALKNDTVPLSDPIQDQIAQINWAAAGSAVGVYHNNRYYLAVPFGASTTNNRVLVFNFLNGEWESVDSYPGDFDVQQWHVLGYGDEQRLHCTSTFGFVYLMEENTADEYGTPGSVTSTDITGNLYTRDYRSGLDRLRFQRVQVTGDFTAGDVVAADFVTKEPDATSTGVIQYTAASTTDASLRRTLHARGQSGSVRITTTAGRPEIRTVMVEAVNSDRQVVNAS